MKDKNLFGETPKQIERDTCIMPDLIAENVINRLAGYLTTCHNRQDLTMLLLRKNPNIINYLADKAERAYQLDTAWQRQIKGKGWKETLHRFMQHWLSSYLKSNLPTIHGLIPREYYEGIPLPKGGEAKAKASQASFAGI